MCRGKRGRRRCRNKIALTSGAGRRHVDDVGGVVATGRRGLSVFGVSDRRNRRRHTITNYCNDDSTFLRVTIGREPFDEDFHVEPRSNVAVLSKTTRTNRTTDFPKKMQTDRTLSSDRVYCTVAVLRHVQKYSDDDISPANFSISRRPTLYLCVSTR